MDRYGWYSCSAKYECHIWQMVKGGGGPELDLASWGLKALPQCFLELNTLRTLVLESNKLVSVQHRMADVV